MAESSPHVPNLVSTGIRGLDDVLGGGLQRRRLYMIEGVPGAGKTTLALQFLLAGAARGESVLYMTLSETAEELAAVAESHGWSLKSLNVREMAPGERALDPDEQSTMFHPSELELATTAKLLLADVERLQATSVVIDSLSELRLLAGTALRYRRQILALKQYFATRGCTVLLLDDLTASEHDLQVRSIAHGVIVLDQLHPAYGSDRRRLRVLKYRGMAFRGGYHDYAIYRGGIEVYPRLVAAEHRQPVERGQLPSGIAELDALLGGGVDRGTSTLIVGPAGTGKSTVASQFVAAAAANGTRAAMFLFDESQSTLLARARGLQIDLDSGIESGAITIKQVDPAELSPGAFTGIIRDEVEERGTSLIVIDSLNGYLNAMPEDGYLITQLHELLAYLGQRNVATVLVSAHQGLIGHTMSSPVDASYLADAIVLLRYFETRGEVRQAISVIKKRGGSHERTIREFSFGARGIQVGEALRAFRGVLTGVPVYDASVAAAPKKGA